MSINPINIVIPMAGDGQRFQSSKWKTLKPFIEWDNKKMIEHVMDNLNYQNNSKFILIMRDEHIKMYENEVLEIQQNYNVEIISISNKTEGPLCSILFAKDLINSDTPLLIANSDQIADCDVNDFINSCLSNGFDGSLLTFEETEKSPRWSFVKTNSQKEVIEVKAKVPFSDEGVVGWYFYKKGSDFIDAAIDLIIHNDRANNEFFQCPTYNYAIKRGGRFTTYMIKETSMHGTGTPDDLEHYLTFLAKK
ncbi:MAG: glycosyltransferase family 2 protein [Brevinema sp.]